MRISTTRRFSQQRQQGTNLSPSKLEAQD